MIFFLTFASVLVVSCLRASLLDASIDPDLTCSFLPTPATSFQFSLIQQLRLIIDNSVIIIEWSIIETHVGIICACIPVIHRPLIMLMVKVWSTSKKKTRTAPRLKRSDQDLHTALATQDTHWLSLEPLEASRPTRMTNVLTRPRAPPGDDVESLNYSGFIKKTTDISIQYDRSQPSWPLSLSFFIPTSLIILLNKLILVVNPPRGSWNVYRSMIFMRETCFGTAIIRCAQDMYLTVVSSCQ